MYSNSTTRATGRAMHSHAASSSTAPPTAARLSNVEAFRALTLIEESFTRFVFASSFAASTSWSSRNGGAPSDGACSLYEAVEEQQRLVLAYERAIAERQLVATKPTVGPSSPSSPSPSSSSFSAFVSSPSRTCSSSPSPGSASIPPASSPTALAALRSELVSSSLKLSEAFRLSDPDSLTANYEHQARERRRLVAVLTATAAELRERGTVQGLVAATAAAASEGEALARLQASVEALTKDSTYLTKMLEIEQQELQLEQKPHEELIAQLKQTYKQTLAAEQLRRVTAEDQLKAQNHGEQRRWRAALQHLKDQLKNLEHRREEVRATHSPLVSDLRSHVERLKALSPSPKSPVLAQSPGGRNSPPHSPLVPHSPLPPPLHITGSTLLALLASSPSDAPQISPVARLRCITTTLQVENEALQQSICDAEHDGEGNLEERKRNVGRPFFPLLLASLGALLERQLHH
eukprot:GHVT01020149.1.p1 GENE.GHVT01020149.1~~GHVT01020149.1.p1  ORF type:complete len:464 (+),score=103.86 GHVT01020149.1:3397-4788(+)